MKIKKLAGENCVFMTEWTIPFKGDKFYYLIEDYPLGQVVPAYSYPEKRDCWMPKTQPYRKYYYEIDDMLFKNEKELNDCLEEFSGFDSYSGYIVVKDKFEVF